MSKKREYGLGALMPEGREWEIGRTAASSSFVQSAKKYIKQCKNQEEIKLLENAIEEIKSKKRELTDWLTAEQFLQKGGFP